MKTEAPIIESAKQVDAAFKDLNLAAKHFEKKELEFTEATERHKKAFAAYVKAKDAHKNITRNL